MTSIKDISRELGIGVSTVSMALNDNPRISKTTRELVQQTAREMKYVKNGAAVDLQKKKTNIILLVLYDASRAFFSETIKRLQISIDKVGYDFIIATTYGGHAETAEKFIRERRTDAVIVYTKTIDDALIGECASEDFPIFVLGHEANTKNPYVKSFMSQKEVQPLATCEYLISKGHKRIGFVTGFRESYGTIRSMNGYRLSMENHGLKIDESLIFDARGSQSEDGYRVTREEILSRIDDMDAIVFSNDDIAIGAMRCFNEYGIAIPDRLSVTGMHNVPGSATTNPPLTTLTYRSNVADFYDKLVEYLVSCIDRNPQESIEEMLAGEQSETIIVERDTVKDIRNI